jgi:hypothetical protein
VGGLVKEFCDIGDLVEQEKMKVPWPPPPPLPPLRVWYSPPCFAPPHPQAIGARNLRDSQAKQRETAAAHLQGLIADRQTELERCGAGAGRRARAVTNPRAQQNGSLQAQCDALLKLQSEQEALLEQFASAT